MAQTKKAPSTPLQSVVAGAASGGVESLVTYPTEFIKTSKQLLHSTESPLRILTNTIRSSGFGALYAGAGAFVASNASKSGVRFLTFDSIKKRLPQDVQTGRPTKVSSMIAGVVAGTMESITVVTPGENIKTRIIEDRAAAKRFKTTGRVVRDIMATSGLRGFFRGVLPVTLKQGSNALVRFTSYTSLLEVVEPMLAGVGSAGFAPGMAGALAGVATVYATMPFDVVKTRMQIASSGRTRVGTVECFSHIVKESGCVDSGRGRPRDWQD